MILNSILLLGVIGLIAALLLYIAAKRFAVKEDPRIAEVEEILPGANCGACGYSGCAAFARACCSASSLEGMKCTSLSAEGMCHIADIVGLAPSISTRKVAVIRCQNFCDDRPPVNHYDGVNSCAIEHSLYQGEADCIYGCLALGDCVKACPFGAMTITPGQSLPQIDYEKCTGCGKCFEACPRQLPKIVEAEINADGKIEKKDIVWVACANRDRGPVAMKECNVSCIGCQKCKKTCTHDAVEITDFLAKIDDEKCVGCGECIEPCPRHSITRIAL